MKVIGLSFLGGAHLVYCQEVLELMKARDLEDILVVVGGVIPRKDHMALKKMGVDGIFPANTITQEIIQFLDQRVGGMVE